MTSSESLPSSGQEAAREKPFRDVSVGKSLRDLEVV